MAFSELDEKREIVKQALLRLPADKEPDFTRLVNSLSHNNADIRKQGRRAILAYADLWWKNQVPQFERSGMEMLLTLLKTSDDTELQTFAVDALTHLGLKASETVPGLVKIAHESRDAKVLAGAMSVLKSMGAKTDEALAVFEKHLDHSSISVKDSAASALLAIEPNRLRIDNLISLLGRPEPEIRTVAKRLVQQKMPTITPKDLTMLQGHLKRPVPEILFVVMEAIGSLREQGKDAAQDLIPLIGSPEKEVSAQAIVTLEKIGKLADVTREITDAAILTPTLAALRAKKIYSKELLAACEKHLDNPDLGVKDAAALLLFDNESSDLPVDKLLACASSANEQVRMASEKLLRKKLSLVTAKDLPALRRGLQNPTRDVRLVFVDAIRL
jgi:hypothetical protein